MEVKRAYRFKVGDCDCLSISDGTLPVPDLQPGKSRSQYDQKPGQFIEIMCLLIRTGKQTVLIDTGFGLMGQPSAGKLLQNLSIEGIRCVEIDKIIITHIHPDHIGGNTDNELRSTFPNARYLVSKKEWEYWTSGPDLSKFSQSVQKDFLDTVQKRLLPVRSQIDLIDGETAVLPGISFINAPGHTPGLVVVSISSDNEQLLCVSDLFHDASELAGPELEMLGDSMPKQASLTRIQILSQLVKPETMVFASHFPFPGLGHILPKGDAWYWQPSEKESTGESRFN
jgi:glyoxylase-like metal-dependent hydrolase (beta-lactamase superfamily II)